MSRTLVAVAALVSIVALAQVARSSEPTFDERVFPSFSSPSVSFSLNGRRWEAGRTTSNLGEDCIWIKHPVGHEGGCLAAGSSYFDRGPIYAGTTWTAEISLVSGVALPEIKTLRLVHSDCSTRAVNLGADGTFLTVFRSSAAAPFQLIGSDASGRPIASHAIEGRAAGAPLRGRC